MVSQGSAVSSLRIAVFAMRFDITVLRASAVDMIDIIYVTSTG